MTAVEARKLLHQVNRNYPRWPEAVELDRKLSRRT
jgi:hypothetical protein